MIESVSYHECKVHCTSEKAVIFADLGKLTDLIDIFPHLSDKYPNFWLLTNQQDVSKGYYGASYNVTTLFHDEVTSILPQSDKIKSVN